MRAVFCFLLAILPGIIGCDKTSHEEVDLLQLFAKEKELNCELASMKDRITKEWDNINFLLKENLAPDMPEEEKANMLKVRNANLIRMFQSFNDMDEELKMALKETEEIDLEMTKRINVLKKESNEIESQKMILFQIINEKKGSEEVARLKDVNVSIRSQGCK